MSQAASSSYAGAAARSTGQRAQKTNKSEKEKDIRLANITAGRAVADAIRTSLGPRGMDKMIVEPDDEVMVTNDGRTILEHMKVTHPAAKMLVQLSKAQDDAAGDGTTSVVVFAGSLLDATLKLMHKGIHPTTIADAFHKSALHCKEILMSMAIKVDLSDRDSLLKSAVTSLNSKVVSSNSELLAPMAVDAVLGVINPETATSVDLSNIRIVKNLGETVDSSELVDGIVFTQKARHNAGGPTQIKDAKIALVQFQLSPPKPNIDHNVVISDYSQMDRVFKEEKKYILRMVRTIKKSGCNVLLVQKSILRDAVNDLALHYLAKSKIMVVTEIERSEIEFIAKTLNCKPIAAIEGWHKSKLGSAGLVKEEGTSSGKIIKVLGVPNPGQTLSVLLRGSNQLTLDEADRSLHDALCVIRSLVEQRFLLPGGAAPEIELSLKLHEFAKSLQGKESYCVHAYADAFEVIPYTLAENAGLSPISIVTELRNRHVKGEKYTGINVRKGSISDMLKENVVQPMLVNLSAINLSTETVNMILKIDDIIEVLR